MSLAPNGPSKGRIQVRKPHDVSDLAEAIDRFSRGARIYLSDHHAELLEDAARRVLKGEQVQWCEGHRAPAPGGLECVARWVPLFDPDEDGPCSIVPKLLVDP